MALRRHVLGWPRTRDASMTHGDWKGRTQLVRPLATTHCPVPEVLWSDVMTCRHECNDLLGILARFYLRRAVGSIVTLFVAFAPASMPTMIW
jgi:hypothetical protein